VKQYAAADYDSRAVEAARRVLIELMRVLGEYDEEIAVVGGWVPPLLMPGAGHIGSTDVDLALDHEALQEPRYATLRALLERSGYYADEEQNYVFYRDVTLDDGAEPDPVVVEVDLVAAEYGLAGGRRQSQPVQDLRARKARGADLLFDRGLAEEVPVEGPLPSGATLRTRVRVAGPVPFLVMKANAIARRDKPKDAYDVWFLLSNHKAGLEGLAAAVAEHADHGLVQEALGHLADAFASVDHVGPRAVAEFLELEPGTEEYDRVRQDAYQRTRYILQRLPREGDQSE
jgi:hypothetical protein